MEQSAVPQTSRERVERTLGKTSELLLSHFDSNQVKRNEIYAHIDDITMRIAELHHAAGREAITPPQAFRREIQVELLKGQQKRLGQIAQLYGQIQFRSRDASRDINAVAASDITQRVNQIYPFADFAPPTRAPERADHQAGQGQRNATTGATTGKAPPPGIEAAHQQAQPAEHPQGPGPWSANSGARAPKPPPPTREADGSYSVYQWNEQLGQHTIGRHPPNQG